jgi:uncharacterized protein (TIGR01777 family)
MRVLVTGGTGFVGKALVSALQGQGHEVVLLTRSDVPAPGSAFPPKLLAGVDAIVNLAGENIAGARWTPAYKNKIRDSRIFLTRSLVEACLQAGTDGRELPGVFVSISAVGYYGTHPSANFTEQSPPGAGWLSTVAKDWEAEATRVQEAGVRLVILRLGVVLGPGGFLERMATPFRLFAGGPAGTGRQWISWVHRDDVVAVIKKALVDPTMMGAYNLTAPEPVTMDEMADAIGAAVHRPSWLRTPSLPLRLLFGEMADELILQGQRVLPERLRKSGYRYQQPELRAAVKKSLDKE